jgi:beta-galactosidase
MFTRRRFLTSGAAAAPLAAVPRMAAAEPPVAAAQHRVSLDGLWSFRLDADARWRPVQVPHTWQIEPENTEYRGIAWYTREFNVPESWRESAVRIEFEAVFHSATVSINGTVAGEHVGKGYTAFTIDLSSLLRYGAVNTLLVKVDNAFNENMLPRGRSSDWAHDGGIYRPVQLLVTPKVYIERVAIDADPNIVNAVNGAKTASVEVTAVVRNSSSRAWEGEIGYRIHDQSSGNPVLQQPGAAVVKLAAGETQTVRLPRSTVRDPRLWHFDRPDLYRLTAELSSGHSIETTFGIRKIEIRGTSFYLNGERVQLMGVERMAGSNPEYGMAEPASWLAHDHDDMKALNCVYTRVHWPQDRRTLDWCDRHGILIQTEVPTWGPATFRGMRDEPDAVFMINGLEQLREMIARDRNHPCIFSWGVCNEIGGQNPPAYQFAKRMYEESKKLDPKRLVSYASHSLFKTPGQDVAGLMDYVMCNEYVGSWQKGGTPEVIALVESIHQAFPDKPLVISEYGYCACTADRQEGDGRRISVLLSQDRVFRKYDYIAGLIFFCYNDYRTHVGNLGAGVMRQRVHGVVDVYGNRKPSYADLRTESSPLEFLEVGGKLGELTVRLKTRAAVPSYTLQGYKLRAVVYGYGDIPLERIERAVPDLAPGVEHSDVVKFTETRPVRVEVDFMRPTGYSAHAGVWKL